MYNEDLYMTIDLNEEVIMDDSQYPSSAIDEVNGYCFLISYYYYYYDMTEKERGIRHL